MSGQPLTVLYSSPASRPQWRQVGGGRRAAQVRDILAAHGISWILSDDIRNPAFGRAALLRAALHLRWGGQPAVKFRADRGIIRHLANDYLRHRWFFAQHPEVGAFLIDNCTDYAQLRAARDAGVPVVALPMNFEVWQRPEQQDFYSGEPMPASLHREATFIARSDAVFCISREEQWYLANYGAAADYLPYLPPAGDRAPLAAIRSRRQAGAPATGEVFAITTASNLRNREGLLALAALVRSLPADPGFRLHVGGRGTAGLRDHFPSDRCTFHGELSEEAMAGLMVRCQAGIVFQQVGTGALTRIPELLCAGVPVLANPHAARSFHGTAGVHVFHDAAGFSGLCRQPLPLPPAPEPDVAAENRFVAAIRRLAATRAGT